jgi:hypothetical protein
MFLALLRELKADVSGFLVFGFARHEVIGARATETDKAIINLQAHI